MISVALMKEIQKYSVGGWKTWSERQFISLIYALIRAVKGIMCSYIRQIFASGEQGKRHVMKALL